MSSKTKYQRRRNRSLLSAGATGMFAKLASVGSTFITMPIALNYLGDERFGIWMTMSSLVGFLAFSDFGIGNGLLSSVATANGNDDMPRVQVLVSSAYFGLGLIAVALILTFLSVFFIVPWDEIFNISDETARGEVGPAVAILVICFAITIPLSIVARTQMGLQMGFLSNLWQGASSLLTLAAVILAVYFAVSLPVLVLAYVGAPLFIHLINTFVFFALSRPNIAPSINAVDFAALYTIVRIGVLFAVLQALAALTYLSDNLIISHILGPKSVAEYAVPEKLFSLVSTMMAVVLAPLWPAYGEAYVRNEREWMATTIKRSMLFSFCIALIAACFFIKFGPLLIAAWVNGIVTPSVELLVGLGAWKIMECVGLSLAMALNGMRMIGFQIVTGILTAISAVGLKLLFIQDFGVEVIAPAITVSYFFFTFLPLALCIIKRLRY